MEKQLTLLKQDVESKVNRTAEDAKIRQQELEKELSESNFKAGKMAEEVDGNWQRSEKPRGSSEG